VEQIDDSCVYIGRQVIAMNAKDKQMLDSRGSKAVYSEAYKALKETEFEMEHIESSEEQYASELYGMPKPVRVFGYFFFGSVAIITTVSFVVNLIFDK
jgi:hypothetical protein